MLTWRAWSSLAARVTQIMNLLNLTPEIQERFYLGVRDRAIVIFGNIYPHAERGSHWSRQREWWKNWTAAV